MSTPLVVQWLSIRLPVQGTQAPSLAWEDSTGQGVAKPMGHNYRTPRAESPHTATKSSPHTPLLEEAGVQQWRPSTAGNKQVNRTEVFDI